MALTKAQTAAKDAKKLEAAADTAQPGRDLQAEAQAGYAEANALPEPASYVYTGGLNAVVVVLEGLGAYDFRHGEPVHLSRPAPGLEDHPDFKRVALPEGDG